MRKFIKVFEEHVGEHGAAIESPRPNTNGNYALATAKDFHIDELLGEIDEELDGNLNDDEKAKEKARLEIAHVWIKAIQEWATPDGMMTQPIRR